MHADRQPRRIDRRSAVLTWHSADTSLGGPQGSPSGICHQVTVAGKVIRRQARQCTEGENRQLVPHKYIITVIVVINVRKKIKKKTLKNAFFYPKNKKNVCKRDKKRYPLFLLAFDVEPVDKITDIN